MLVYVDQDSWHDYYCLMEIDKDSSAYQRERAVEIPDELVARHNKAEDEYGKVQELLRAIWNTKTG